MKYYEKLYHNETFKPVVITNAVGFTTNAKERAEANDVELIAYDELAKLFADYPVIRS